MKSLQVRQLGGASQSGFTIVELVVVILLLGILTATALPRFLDISDDAHQAVVEAHLGSLATATALYRAAWFANQKDLTNAIDYDGPGAGVGLFASDTGYPTGALAGTDAQFPETAADCVAIFTNLMQGSGTSLQASAIVSGNAATAAGAGTILDGASSPFTPWAGEEFATILVDANATPDAADSCEYYYTGQFNTEGSTPRYITYTPATGAISIATSAALTGDP